MQGACCLAQRGAPEDLNMSSKIKLLRKPSQSAMSSGFKAELLRQLDETA
jgi:hypothetical protein